MTPGCSQLARGATPAAIAGVGGTRYCDWWFTEEAVLIDTAGRYTTQDSDAKGDKESWFSYLEQLKKSRPRQPINGVLVAISVEDILTLPKQELAAHANAIRARLLDLHQRLFKVNFPVYTLFTKTDLVAGFNEYFSYLNEAARRQVWGATFQTADKKKNLVGEVPAEYNLLLERLSEETVDRLQDEPVPQLRVQLFGSAQMARLKSQVHDFLNQIFEPTRYQSNATLRGFYFTSGTQEGHADRSIDRLRWRGISAREGVSTRGHSGSGKSFFLTDLISGNHRRGGLGFTDQQRRATRFHSKTVALSLIGLASVALPSQGC